MADLIIADLNSFLEHETKADSETAAQLRSMEAEVRGFLKNIVVAAFEELRPTLEAHGRRVQVFGNHQQDAVSIVTLFREKKELDYCIKVDITPVSALPSAQVKLRNDSEAQRCNIRLSHEAQDSINNVCKEDVMQSFLEQYKRLKSH